MRQHQKWIRESQESMNNVRPSGVYLGRYKDTLKRRKRIKQQNVPHIDEAGLLLRVGYLGGFLACRFEKP